MLKAFVNPGAVLWLKKIIEYFLAADKRKTHLEIKNLHRDPQRYHRGPQRPQTIEELTQRSTEVSQRYYV